MQSTLFVVFVLFAAVFQAVPTVAKCSNETIGPKEVISKFMVVGDSISHGMQDDWTWRWRLYSWLTTQGHAVQFFGPEKGTNGPSAPASARPSPPPYPGVSPPAPDYSTIGTYAPAVSGPFLDSGHAAHWGKQAAQVVPTIQEWVQTYQPDYILLLLGFNDLGWTLTDAAGLARTIQTLIDNARRGKPSVKILLGNVVQRSDIGRADLVQKTDAYNVLARDIPARMYRPDSPISYVDVQRNYDCDPASCPDGHDGLHPNARGEHHIAQAFARVLKADFGFTGSDFQLPDNVDRRIPSVPTGVAALSVPEGIYLSWNWAVNARGYEVRSRLQGTSGWSQSSSNSLAAYSTSVTDSSTWEYQVRATGDGNARSDWSRLTSATAHPETSPAPNNIVVKSRPTGIEVTWDAVAGFDVDRYAITVWDTDTPGAFPAVYGENSTRFIMDNLLRHRYSVSVATWVNLAEGPAGGVPSAYTAVTVGA